LSHLVGTALERRISAGSQSFTTEPTGRGVRCSLTGPDTTERRRWRIEGGRPSTEEQAMAGIFSGTKKWRLKVISLVK
jgi:hypothetical protein